MCSTYDFVFHFCFSAQGRSFGSCHNPLKNLLDLITFGVAHVIINFCIVWYHIRGLASGSDYIVYPGFLGYVLTHQVNHIVHGFHGIKRRPSPFRSSCCMCGESIEPELG